MLRLVLANTVFHKRSMLPIFHAEYTESALNIISYPKSAWAHHEAGEKFSKLRFSEGWNTLC